MRGALNAEYALNLPGETSSAADLDLARSDAQEALKLDPRNAEAYVGLAGAQPGIRNWPQRYRILQQGYANDPDNADINIALEQIPLNLHRILRR